MISKDKGTKMPKHTWSKKTISITLSCFMFGQILYPMCTHAVGTEHSAENMNVVDVAHTKGAFNEPDKKSFLEGILYDLKYPKIIDVSITDKFIYCSKNLDKVKFKWKAHSSTPTIDTLLSSSLINLSYNVVIKDLHTNKIIVDEHCQNPEYIAKLEKGHSYFLTVDVEKLIFPNELTTEKYINEIFVCTEPIKIGDSSPIIKDIKKLLHDLPKAFNPNTEVHPLYSGEMNGKYDERLAKVNQAIKFYFGDKNPSENFDKTSVELLNSFNKDLWLVLSCETLAKKIRVKAQETKNSAEKHALELKAQKYDKEALELRKEVDEKLKSIYWLSKGIVIDE